MEKRAACGGLEEEAGYVVIGGELEGSAGWTFDWRGREDCHWRGCSCERAGLEVLPARSRVIVGGGPTDY